MTLTLELPPDLEARLTEEAQRRGMTLPEYALERLQESKEHPLIRLAREIQDSVPEEEWQKLPADLSKNVDHYLYGHPRKEP